MSTNGTWAARRAASRYGSGAAPAIRALGATTPSAAAVLAEVPLPYTADTIAPPVVPLTKSEPVRVVAKVVDLRPPEQVDAERASRRAQQEALRAETPDDIPDEPAHEMAPPVPSADDEPADGELAPQTDGLVVLALRDLPTYPPHIMRVGAGPLPEWCGTRPLGVRWASGWWTDAGPLPAKAKAAPEGTSTARVALPGDAAGAWARLEGQTNDGWAWVLALDVQGDVVGAFHVPRERRAGLLDALGAQDAGTPPEDDWVLLAGERFNGEPASAERPAIEPAQPITGCQPSGHADVDDVDPWAGSLPEAECDWAASSGEYLAEDGWALPGAF
ncbi:hypothetical protein CHO01_28890 [Cellulomonas hominis]|uniref:Uncharacterized protein n=1 Tax=Cellulomonas hominis TaxID=156981 RepID=A0A511FEY7_9CELL|nr:hypothetical protein [Cellulomonas hominis]MBB5474760.1 hypothetical protein [Cellulomonas hominis]GEL47773.1 hypothetical protein CHO01_28890 [Cellulomonas hominis]